MLDIILLGVLTAVSVFALLLLAPISLRRLLFFIYLFDVTVSIGLVLVYAGTFSGTVTGFVAGLTFSVLLRVARWFVGYERFDFRFLRWVDERSRTDAG